MKIEAKQSKPEGGESLSPGGRYIPPKHRLSESFLATVRKYLAADVNHRVWFAGSSGTGKSYIMSRLGGWDLDHSASWVKQPDGKLRWSLDPKEIPKEARAVAGCFSFPLYAEFVREWKPTKIYLIEVPKDTYMQTFLWKAANKRFSKALRIALGTRGADLTRVQASTHPLADAEGVVPKVWEKMLGTDQTLRKQQVPFEIVVNDFKNFAGPAWHSELSVSYPREIIGLVYLWHDTQDVEARKRIRALLIKTGCDPKLNVGWGAFVKECVTSGVRLSPTIVASAKEARRKSTLANDSAPVWVRKAIDAHYNPKPVKA